MIKSSDLIYEFSCFAMHIAHNCNCCFFSKDGDLFQPSCNSTYNYVVVSFHGHLCEKTHPTTLAHDALHALVSSLNKQNVI